MPVSLDEYLGVVLMKFEEELQLLRLPSEQRKTLYRALQGAMRKADEWKVVADPLIRTSGAPRG